MLSKLKLPKGHFVVEQIKTVPGGEVEYVVTTTIARDKYYLYKLSGQSLTKIDAQPAPFFDVIENIFHPEDKPKKGRNKK